MSSGNDRWRGSSLGKLKGLCQKQGPSKAEQSVQWLSSFKRVLEPLSPAPSCWLLSSVCTLPSAEGAWSARLVLCTSLPARGGSCLLRFVLSVVGAPLVSLPLLSPDVESSAPSEPPPGPFLSALIPLTVLGVFFNFLVVLIRSALNGPTRFNT